MLLVFLKFRNPIQGILIVKSVKSGFIELIDCIIQTPQKLIHLTASATHLIHKGNGAIDMNCPNLLTLQGWVGADAQASTVLEDKLAET